MKKRVVLLAAALLLWFSAWVAYGRADTEVVRLAESLSRPDPAWARETLFLIDAHSNRTSPLLLSGQFGRPRHSNKDRIRVLVFGDSFTHGWALADPDANWTTRLERALNDATRPGTFEVVALARPGASAYDHGDWAASIMQGNLDDIQASDADKRLLLEPFDVMVLGFVNNDRLPMDSPGTWKVFGREMEITAETYNAIQFYERDNPYQMEFDAALVKMRLFAGSTSLLWAPLEQAYYATPSERNLMIFQKNLALYKNAGFIPVTMNATRTLGEKYQLSELTVTAADSHPSTALTQTYAIDVAAAVLAQVGPARLERAVRGTAPIEYPPVSGVLPLWLRTTPARSEVRVVLDPQDAATMAEYCVSHSRPQLRQVCDRAEQYVEIAAKRYPRQVYPCAALGRPYVHIQTDPSHVDDVHISVRSTDKAKIDVFGYGYDAEGFPRTEPLGVSGAGETVVLPTGSGLHGVLLASRAVSSCYLGDSFATAFAPLEVLLKF
jgi:hypothetical protein